LPAKLYDNVPEPGKSKVQRRATHAIDDQMFLKYSCQTTI
jgi:hypothetical protein